MSKMVHSNLEQNLLFYSYTTISVKIGLRPSRIRLKQIRPRNARALAMAIHRKTTKASLSFSNQRNLRNYKAKNEPQFRWEAKTMGVTKEQVESTLNSKLNPVHLDVTDTSGGCGASFVIDIVSEKFEGKRLLERHRLVNAALQEEMKQIHALSIKKALTPEQWKQQEESAKSKTAD